MSERVLRLALVGITFVILFLPYQGDTGESVLVISYWYSTEALFRMVSATTITVVNRIEWLGLILFFLT